MIQLEHDVKPSGTSFLEKEKKMSTFGTRLKILRDKQSLESFSNTLGIHRVTLSRFEKDERVPDADFLKKLVEQIGVCSEWLLFGTEPMFKEERPTCRTNFDAENSQPIEIKYAEISKPSDASDNFTLQRELTEVLREQNALIRENGDLRVENERHKAQIRELEREIEALHKTMKPAAVSGMDRQDVA